MNILVLFGSSVFGYFLVSLIAGKKVQEIGRVKSLKVKVKNHVFHIHHWFGSGIILGNLVAINWYNAVVYGLLIGFIIQGLTYKDFYKIIYRRNRDKK